jgi:hypothetical protein
MMRLLVVAPLVVALSLPASVPAAASCAPPASVADNASRATVVVYGVVTNAGAGVVTLRVDRILKGQVGASVQVFVGPGRGGGGGTAVATSIDYMAPVGSDHVLYLIRAGDGELETNACNGSHSGPTNAAERTYFGAGTSATGGSAPGAVTAAPQIVPATPQFSPESLAAWPALILLIVGAAAVLLLRRRIA